MKTAWKWGGAAILQAGLVVCLAAGAWAGERSSFRSDDSVPRTLQPVIDEGNFAMADQQDPAPPVPPDSKAPPAPEKASAKAKSAATVADECATCEESCGRCRWFDANDCDECTPYWTATTGAMVLHRSGARNYVIGDGPFRSGQFDLGWSTGPRVEIARHYQRWDLEFVYWGQENFGDEMSQRIDLLPPVRELASYSSRMYNWEWNLKRKFEGITFLAGTRYMELQEKLYDEEAGLLLTHFEMQKAANYLYGFQIGAEADFLHTDRFSLDGFIKVGGFSNHIHETESIGNQFISINRWATHSKTAMVGEVGLNAKAQLSRHLSAYGGYEVMWIDGVVLAPDMLGAIRLTATRTNTPIYHGANFGLEFRW